MLRLLDPLLGVVGCDRSSQCHRKDWKKVQVHKVADWQCVSFTSPNCVDFTLAQLPQGLDLNPPSTDCTHHRLYYVYFVAPVAYLQKALYVY